MSPEVTEMAPSKNPSSFNTAAFPETTTSQKQPWRRQPEILSPSAQQPSGARELVFAATPRLHAALPRSPSPAKARPGHPPNGSSAPRKEQGGILLL